MSSTAAAVGAGQRAAAPPEVAALLFTMHQQLQQHQAAVHQAFASLDQACCGLAATVATAHTSAALNTATVSTPSAVLFAQLLHRVAALHRFLFANLYMHQRESVLGLVAGIERCVLAAAGGAADDTGDTGSDGHRELRRQIHLVRLLFSRPTEAHPSGGGGAAGLLDGAVSASPLVESSSASPEPSQAAAAAAAAANAYVPREWPRPPGPRVRLFALSSALTERGGPAGQQTLAAVLSAGQRRFKIHVVVLCPTAGPVAEVEEAVRLGCVCLVVRQDELRLYPVQHAGLIITSDRAVMAQLDRTGGGSDAEHAPHASQPSAEAGVAWAGEEGAMDEDEGDEDGGGSFAALEELFLSLEADAPVLSADRVWPPHAPARLAAGPTAGGARDDSRGEAETRVVGRAALRRDTAERWKRRRGDAALEGAAAPGAAAPLPRSDVDASRRRWSESVAHVAADEDAVDTDIITSQYTMESQHVGITQRLPRLSGSPTESTHVTPVLRSAEEASAEEQLPPPVTTSPLVFQISNSVKYLKARLIEAVEELGGTVDQSPGYRPGCRFLVVAEGITERTEKYLGACAAAAYIVPPRFVFDSQRRGYWLTGRAHNYDMSPQRSVAHAPNARPIFSCWRVVLLTCRCAAARGVRAALVAGGCTQVTAFVVDPTAEPQVLAAGARPTVYDASSASADGVVEGVCPSSVLAPAMLQAATHILIDCSSVTAQGHFHMPEWVPAGVRLPEYRPRLFTLELLYHCLCAHPARIFDAEGQLGEVGALTPACRIEEPPDTGA